jgi:integrating conjugative element protein (TIGR03761 family)
MTAAPSGRQTLPVDPDDDTARFPGPAALQGQAWLTLQTHHAQRLLRGRPAAAGKPAIIGLFGFSERLRGIWQGARQDDPYADWWLVKIEEALLAGEQMTQAEQATLAERLEALPALEVRVAASRKPYRTPLRFANPYAFRGARLLGRYDELARGVLTARHVGLMETNEAERLLGRCAGKVRGLFCLPQGYRFLGIDRETLAQGTAKAEQARKAMGEVPADVLSEDRRAALAPRKTPIQGPIPSNLKLHPVAPRSPESQAPAVDVADGNADG